MEEILQRFKVINISEIAKNLGKTVTIGSYEIALFHLANGEFVEPSKIAARIKVESVEGMISGEHVFCPMHDWKINLADGKVQKPDHGCVRSFVVEVENDDVYIILPK